METIQFSRETRQTWLNVEDLILWRKWRRIDRFEVLFCIVFGKKAWENKCALNKFYRSQPKLCGQCSTPVTLSRLMDGRI